MIHYINQKLSMSIAEEMLLYQEYNDDALEEASRYCQSESEIGFRCSLYTFIDDSQLRLEQGVFYEA